jgi:hypothetical protein
LFFSAPPFTGPRRYALLVRVIGLFSHRSASPSAASAQLCGFFNHVSIRMLVRGPVHGMQGPLEKLENQLICFSVFNPLEKPAGSCRRLTYKATIS